MAIFSTTAQAISGDLLISLSPADSSDFIAVCTSQWENTNIPGGWTRAGSGFYTIPATSTSLLTFDIANQNTPSPQWSAVMIDFATTGTVTQEFGENVDFGNYPETSYTRVVTTTGGDAILCSFSLTTLAPPTIVVTDDQNNAYLVYQNTQLLDGIYCTAYVAVALNCPAATTTVTITTSGIPSEGGQGFAVYLFTYSGLAALPPTIFFQAVPSTISLGESSLLNWVVMGANSQSIDEGIGAVSATGSTTVTPDVSTYYHLTASNSAYTVVAYAYVEVLGNEAAFSLQKIVLTVKQDRIPVRGKNG